MTRILIVDDEARVRNIYSIMLENEGFKVLEAKDATEASIILNREPLDIMLLDIKMPQVYGSVFYDVIQNFHQKVRVIVASVYPVDEQKKIIRGAADYFDKAQGIDALLEKVKNADRQVKQQVSILIVDDEPKIRQIYRYYLEEHGYRVIEAHDGAVGLEILRKNTDISIVILDIAMPKKNGFEALKQMKREFPAVKILIGSVFSEDAQKTMIPGADGNYDKSEDASGLIKKIEELLNPACTA